jgi:NTP pyrophosphatase (non-canonical NTP hydrolase)
MMGNITAGWINLGSEFQGVWGTARANHKRYSDVGDKEQSIRFLSLGLAGEAGEVANFVKKRWRDGDAHEADLWAEVADVFLYNIMLADALGMSAHGLLEEAARKQQVFADKMKAREAGQ